MDHEKILDEFRLALRGDAGALTRHLQSLHSYLLVMAAAELEPELGPKVGASDLVQETMVEARRDFGQFTGKSPAEFVAWLRRILHNNVANVRRRYKHTRQRGIDREVPLTDGDSQELAQSLRDPSATPQAKAMARELTELVDAALARLPPEYQTVIRLKYAEGLTFVEIGARMDRTAEAVRKLWTRAIDRMKRELEEEAGQPHLKWLRRGYLGERRRSRRLVFAFCGCCPWKCLV